ncbi:glutathione S-transferase family protein [Blastomonas sp. SL216]|uniref:glutathione S-transferase family protein n=1 Tax=Blastomonas sp. SL216 TaxID=2995169 RepID=UPI0023777306|nr:glutathione binding-like protein [Blastomonas sp. SL216]
MIEVYAFATPNSIKVPIALEEAGLEYTLHSVNVRAGDQKLPGFLALNPNAKVPVLVDPHGPDGDTLLLTESAAILVYIAEKSGQMLPAIGTERARVFEQLFFHASALSPSFGQAGYFQRFAPEPMPHAIGRFLGEANRLVDLLEAKLERHRFVAGEEITIADIAHYGWLWRREFIGIDFENRPNLARWFEALAARPSFQRAEHRLSALAPT